MHLKIKPRSNLVSRMYEEHGQFHVGDAGLDLFIVEEQTIERGKTELINFIMKSFISYFLKATFPSIH